MEQDIEVLALAHWADEGLARGAPGTTSNGALRQHKARLLGAIYVAILVAHLHARKRGLGPGGGAIEIGLLKRECGDFK